MTLTQFLQVVELRTKVISISTYTLATLYALARGAAIEPWLAGALLLAVLAVDMGTTAFNSFFDYVRGVDNRLFTVEPDKVLIFEGVAPGHALIVSLALYALAALLGVAIALAVGWWVVGVGALCMLVGFAYTGGPLPISRTPAGELFAGGCLGLVLFLVVAAIHGAPLDGQAVRAALPSTLLIASVLTVNNTCDREGDIASGRRTLSILVGTRAAGWLIYLLGGASFVLAYVVVAPYSGVMGALVLAAGALPAAAIYASIAVRGFSHATKPGNMRAIIRVVWLFTASYGAALALGLLGSAPA